MWMEGVVLCLYWIAPSLKTYVPDGNAKIVERLLETVRNTRMTKPARFAALFLLGRRGQRSGGEV